MTSASGSLPFERYEGGGRLLLGRPRLGDLTARHGYGPPVFNQCGMGCAYCGLDMSSPYENWLQLSVDLAGKHQNERRWYAEHVVQRGELSGPDLPAVPPDLPPQPKPPGEFRFRELPSNVDPKRSLVYLWEIRRQDGSLALCSVGKASGGASRPRTVCPNNIRRLRAGLPWHGQSMDGYRPIHHALSDAVDKGYEVTLTLLCNVEPGEDINEVERRERAKYGCAGR